METLLVRAPSRTHAPGSLGGMLCAQRSMRSTSVGVRPYERGSRLLFPRRGAFESYWLVCDLNIVIGAQSLQDYYMSCFFNFDYRLCNSSLLVSFDGQVFFSRTAQTQCRRSAFCILLIHYNEYQLFSSNYAFIKICTGQQ